MTLLHIAVGIIEKFQFFIIGGSGIGFCRSGRCLPLFAGGGLSLLPGLFSFFRRSQLFFGVVQMFFSGSKILFFLCFSGFFQLPACVFGIVGQLLLTELAGFVGKFLCGTFSF